MEFRALRLGTHGPLVRTDARASGGARGERVPDGEHEARLVHAALAPIVWEGVLIDGVHGDVVGLAGGAVVGLLQGVALSPRLLLAAALRLRPASLRAPAGPGPPAGGLVGAPAGLQPTRVADLLQPLLGTGAQGTLLGLG